jgi:hypothetical protein
MVDATRVPPPFSSQQRRLGEAAVSQEGEGVKSLADRGRVPRRAFARKKSKIQTKSPMCQKRSKSFS